jgi:hypothetical protein
LLGEGEVALGIELGVQGCLGLHVEGVYV